MNLLNIQSRTLRKMAYGKFRALKFEEEHKNLRGILQKKSRKIIKKYGLNGKSVQIMRNFYIQKIWNYAERFNNSLIREQISQISRNFDYKINTEVFSEKN